MEFQSVAFVVYYDVNALTVANSGLPVCSQQVQVSEVCESALVSL